MPRKCYQCEKENPDEQQFCGFCGSALSLSDFLSTRVGQQLAVSLKDRNVVETESAIRVFERAWGWMKIVGGIAAVLLAIVGAGVFWKVSDFWSGVDKAKQSVVDTAASTKSQIDETSRTSINEINQSATAAKTASHSMSSQVQQETQRITQLSSSTRKELASEAADVRGAVKTSLAELEAVKKLQPEVQSIRKELTGAKAELQDQQKVLSSSEEFVKHVFSSHRVELFQVGTAPANRYGIVPAPSGQNMTVVYLLLQSAPVENTLQLQFHVYTQPPRSYFTIHNLVVFFWSDSVETLKSKQLAVSYFPDTSDKELIQSLSEHDGRIFADGEQLPKFNQPDPDFKGGKWFKTDPEHPGSISFSTTSN